MTVFFCSLIMVVFCCCCWSVNSGYFLLFQKKNEKNNRLSVNGTRWLAILKSKWALNIQISWFLQYNSHTSVTAFEVKKIRNQLEINHTIFMVKSLGFVRLALVAFLLFLQKRPQDSSSFRIFEYWFYSFLLPFLLLYSSKCPSKMIRKFINDKL